MIKVKDKKELREIIKERKEKSVEKKTYTVDVGDLDVSNIKHMSFMFRNYESLKEIKGLENWDTSNVKYMDSMFYGCSNLEEIKGLENWDVSNITDTEGIFEGTKFKDVKEIKENGLMGLAKTIMYESLDRIRDYDLSEGYVDFDYEEFGITQSIFERVYEEFDNVNPNYDDVLDVWWDGVNDTSFSIHIHEDCWALSNEQIENFVNGNDIDLDQDYEEEDYDM